MWRGNTTTWRKRRKPKSDSFHLLRPLDRTAVFTVERRNEPIDVPNFTADCIFRQGLSLRDCFGVISSIERLCMCNPSFAVQAEGTVSAS